jgi:membrane protein
LAALRATAPSEQESVGALVARLGGDVGRVVRAELALVQVRTEAALGALKAAGGGLAFGLALALVGFGAVTAGGVLVVAVWLPLWLAAFVVGGAILLVALAITWLEIRSLGHGVRRALAPAEDGTPREVSVGR